MPPHERRPVAVRPTSNTGLCVLGATFVVAAVVVAGLWPVALVPTASAADDRSQGPVIGVLLKNIAGTLEISTLGAVQDPADPAPPHESAPRLALDLGSERLLLSSRETLLFQGRRASVGEREVLDRPFRLRMETRSGERSVMQLGKNGKWYEGVLDFFPPTKPGGQWQVVNRLRIERYLPGVLAREMADGFPIQALRAQAIASRSYALFHYKKRGLRARYHLRSDTGSQVYDGVSTKPNIVDAVARTRGLVLTFEGLLFECYYHSTCGGQTAAAVAILGGSDIEPLAPSICESCDQSRFYNWQVTLPMRQIVSALEPIARKHKIKLGKLEAIEPVERGPGGHAAYLRIRHSRGSFEVDAHLFRLRLLAMGVHKLRSTSFHCQPVKAGWLFRGRGWGHGTGMCQMGATGLANRGAANAEDILNRYYRGSTVVRAW